MSDWSKFNPSVPFSVQGRFEHLWTAIGEERHWKKIGKEKYAIGGLFGFEVYAKELEKFLTPKGKGQRKKLSKEYRLSEAK